MKNTFKITKAMQYNALRGIALLKKYKIDEIEGISKSIGKGENLTLDQIKFIYTTLNKSKFDSKPVAEGGRQSDTYYKELALGGSAGLAFAKKALMQEKIVKSINKEVTDEELNKEDKTSINSASIVKSKNEELKQATYVVLEPDCVDEHGDTYDSNEVRKACHNFNQSAAKANLFHLIETNGFHVAESYVSPTDIILGDTFVKKGTWLATLQFTDDDLWQGVKEDLFSGVSIGAMARVEMIDD